MKKKQAKEKKVVKLTKSEYYEWYKSCDFIEKQMQFYSYQDFILNKEEIKFWFNHINWKTKKLYQWYVFASPLHYTQKTEIWNILNNEIN